MFVLNCLIIEFAGQISNLILYQNTFYVGVGIKLFDYWRGISWCILITPSAHSGHNAADLTNFSMRCNFTMHTAYYILHTELRVYYIIHTSYYKLTLHTAYNAHNAVNPTNFSMRSNFITQRIPPRQKLNVNNVIASTAHTKFIFTFMNVHVCAQVYTPQYLHAVTVCTEQRDI